MISDGYHSMEKVTIHGTLVRHRDEGVLFLGGPGAGKSSAALTLLLAGGSLVADDVVIIERKDDGVSGSAPDRLKGIIAIPQLGIFDVREVLGTKYFVESTTIDRCVEIDSKEALLQTEMDILGVKMPLSRHVRLTPEEIERSHATIDTELVKQSESRILEAHDESIASAI